MLLEINPTLCAQLGLSHSQLRSDEPQATHRKLWWCIHDRSERGDRKAFGQGDLNADDLARIQDYLNHPSITQDFAFSGWHEHHGTGLQAFSEAVVFITRENINFPRRSIVKARMRAVRSN